MKYRFTCFSTDANLFRKGRGSTVDHCHLWHNLTLDIGLELGVMWGETLELDSLSTQESCQISFRESLWKKLGSHSEPRQKGLNYQSDAQTIASVILKGIYPHPASRKDLGISHHCPLVSVEEKYLHSM